MLTITLLLLVLGALLASFGMLGFYGNWTSTPDHDSLRFVQALAKTGRRLAYTGLALCVLHYSVGGPALAALLLVGALALATYRTRTTNTIVPTGATP
jgi:alkanesulfonate monooxygenase SsuD/methylene tetrahydromethanopterin reductase-like flavin-dependent oxidoreductase (luciferase family)